MADQVVTKFQEDLKHLEMFLNREKVPFTLKKTVIEYWKYQWKRTGGWSVGHSTSCTRIVIGILVRRYNENAVVNSKIKPDRPSKQAHKQTQASENRNWKFKIIIIS